MRRLLLLVCAVCGAMGQTRPVHLSGSIGYATFIDESDQSHVSTGGAARFYLTRRFAVEPEVLHLYRSAEDSDLLLQANAVRDIGRAYVIGGAGRLWGFRPRFTESTWTASGGVGVRLFVTDRFFISPEARLGTEPILRVQVSFGWASGR